MARSLTIKLPNPRRTALFAGALVLIVGGAFIGVRLGASLLVDPLGGVLADAADHVIVVGKIDESSRLAAAYRQALGIDQSTPAPSD